MNVSLIYTSYIESRFVGVQEEETNRLVIRALQHVIQTTFAQLSATLVITIASGNWLIEKWFQEVLGELVSTWTNVSVQLLHINHMPHVPGRKYCNLLLVDSYESLSSTHIAEDNAGYDDLEYYFIFVQGEDQQVQKELKLILNYCLNNFWLHCNVMVQTAQKEVLIYTYFPYTEKRCQSADAQLVNRFDGRRMVKSPLFPQKLQQLYQCPISLALWNVPPFVELKWDDQAKKLMAFGYEIKLVEQLAHQINFSIVINDLSSKSVATFKSIWSSGLPLGSLQLLLTHHANLSIGNLRKTADRNRLLSSPMTHYHSPIVATVAIRHFHFGHVTMLHFPFHESVWRLLLIALIIHGLVYAWRWRRHSLEVLELLLGVTLERLPQSWLHRIVYAHWLYGSIPLRVVYQSLLFHFIRLQLCGTLPNSVEDLFARNFRGMCTPNLLSVLSEIPQMARHHEKLVTIPTPFDDGVLDALHVMGDKEFFAITGLDTANAYLKATNRRSSYHVLPQYISLQQVVIYMPKHSYFTDQFNVMLRRLDASGFIDYWRRSSFTEYSSSIVEKPSLSQQEKNHQNEQLRQLNGVYILIGVLYTLSVLVFGAELICRRASIRAI